MRLRDSVSALALATVLLLTVTAATAQTEPSGATAVPEVVKVIQFPGGTALPFYVAQEKGFFKRESLDVTLTPTFDSRQLMTAMLQGKCQIGQAAIDNVVAYDENEAAPDLNVPRDLVAVLGTSSTNLDLVVRPNIQSYSDLKGMTLAVDAINTGFAFVLRQMLKEGGLEQDQYRFLSVGGDVARLKELRSGKVAGTLLTTVFANQAVADGMRRLDSSLSVLRHYQGTSVFVRHAWADAHRDELVRLLRALLEAHRWIFDPDHKTQVAEILAGNSQGLSLSVAEKTVDLLTSPNGGLSRSGALDLKGIRVVLALRSRYATPKRLLNDPQRYIDTSFYTEATRHEGAGNDGGSGK